MKNLLLLACVLAGSACGSFPKERRANSRPEVKAPDAAADSFLVSRADKNGIGVVEIGIRKDALDKEFLLQGSMITQQQVAQFSNMKSRIVAFRAANDKVFMFEATQGHSLSQDLPQNLMLAQFPITRVDGDVVYFDFLHGMDEMSLESGWYIEEEGKGKTYKEEYVHGKIAQSYLEDARVVAERNALVIRQVAQIVAPKELPKPEEGEETGAPTTVQMKVPMEARYYLTPYRPREDFSPSMNDDAERYGFFEVAPRFVEGGDTATYASKFHAQTPIVFALSSNMPENVRGAVRDGVLYWNKAFGREAVQVIDAPEGRSAPDYEYNIIQWVKWDAAGYAYADAQMDPRTGEILHAQIFLTSAFAIGSKQNAEKLITMLEKGPDPVATFHIKGLGNNRLCERRTDRRFAASLTALINEGANDARIETAIQDYVREVVAHEVGHTLGLRHNFAGSLAATYDQIERRDLLQSYLNNAVPADFLTTSTVMDYQLFEESVITGRQVAESAKALSYDTNAMGKLYGGQTTPPYTAPLFCTDDHVEEFVDCKVFDTGRSPFAFRAKNPLSTMQRLPYSLANQYVALKEGGLEKDALRKGTAAPEELATQLYEARAELAAFFRGDRKILSVRRSFDYLNSLNEDDVRAAEEAYVTQNVATAGGINKLFAPIGQDAYQKLTQDTLYYVKLSGKFTEEDLTTVGDELGKLVAKLPLALEKEQLKHLTSLEHVRTSGLGTEFSGFLKDEAQRILLAEKTDASGTAVTLSSGRTVTLPPYAYAPETRHTALKLITAKESNPQWGAFERYELKTALKEHVQKVLGVPFDDVNVAEYPRDVARWIVETQQLIEAL